MKLVAYPLAALLGVLGLVFIIGAQGQPLRFLVGGVLLGSGAFLLWLAIQPPKTTVTTIVQKIDLSGDVTLEGMTCRACGGTLGKKSVSVKAGGVFIDCEYCGATYQIEEAPQW